MLTCDGGVSIRTLGLWLPAYADFHHVTTPSVRKSKPVGPSKKDRIFPATEKGVTR